MIFCADLLVPSKHVDQDSLPRFIQELDGPGLVQIGRRVVGTLQIDESPSWRFQGRRLIGREVAAGPSSFEG
jgi:hypothetical protein